MYPSNLAFIINVANPDLVSRALAAAPAYDLRVASAIRRTVQMIHGLQGLHGNTSLQRVEVYLGRTSFSEDYLVSRWNAHWANYKHRYAAVLFTCDANKVNQLERLALRILRRLKYDHGSLCVGHANVKYADQGRPSATDKAVIYMTWRIMPEAIMYEKPGVKIIRAVAQSVYEECAGWIKKAQLVRGLLTLKQLKSKVRLSPAPW
jgi:hypothetical protein